VVDLGRPILDVLADVVVDEEGMAEENVDFTVDTVVVFAAVVFTEERGDRITILVFLAREALVRPRFEPLAGPEASGAFVPPSVVQPPAESALAALLPQTRAEAAVPDAAAEEKEDDEPTAEREPPERLPDFRPEELEPLFFTLACASLLVLIQPCASKKSKNLALLFTSMFSMVRTDRFLRDHMHSTT
jgi:hypothetical protein